MADLVEGAERDAAGEEEGEEGGEGETTHGRGCYTGGRLWPGEGPARRGGFSQPGGVNPRWGRPSNSPAPEGRQILPGKRRRGVAPSGLHGCERRPLYLGLTPQA